MKLSAALLIGTSMFAVAAPATAAVGQNAPPGTPTGNAGETDANKSAYRNEDAIIVTATKRQSTVQNVPFSINAQTERDIRRMNAQTLEDISRNVAGLSVQNLGPGQSQVSIRGVSAGQIIRDQPGVKEQVGVYLDESIISLSLFTPDLDLFDLNRVETLRGPQGTLFGAGSIGGTIRYITNQPVLDRIEGTVEGGINTLKGGSMGYDAKGALNVPIGNTAAARFVAYHTHFGGFIDSVGPYKKDNVNDGDRSGTRVSLLWQPSDKFKITPRFVYQAANANGFNREEKYNLYDNQFVTQDDLGERKQYLKLQEKFRDKTWLADVNASYNFGPVELTSISSRLGRNILVSRDASALTGSVYVSFAGAAPDAVGGANLTSNLRDNTKLKQFSQELRLSSTGTGPFSWVFGGFYSRVNRKYTQRLPTPGADVFSQDFLDVVAPGVPVSATYNGFPADSPYNANLPYIIKQKALFGEGSYSFSQFKLTAGARWYDFNETRDFVSGGIFSNADNRIGDKTSSNGISPRFIATWEPNNHVRVNLQAAKGFRLGGINDPLNLPLCSAADQLIYGPFTSATYKDETVWNYEAGVKYSAGPITFNSAIYHEQMKNLQVTVDAGSCSSRLVFNVPKAHATGFEAELWAHPLQGLDLSLAGNYVDSKFGSTIGNPILAVRTGIIDGNRLPTVPKFTIAATANYSQPLNDRADWYVNASVQHIGNRYTQPGDQETANQVFNFIYYDPSNGNYGTNTQNYGSLQLPAYTLANLSFGVNWHSGLSVVLYANNLFDANPLLSLDRERGGRARLGYNVGQPRQIGLTLRQSFGASTLPPPPPPAPALPPPPAPEAAPAAPPPPPPPPPPVEKGERGW
jgi:iron complex outermembrane receptor protein